MFQRFMNDCFWFAIFCELWECFVGALEAVQARKLHASTIFILFDETRPLHVQEKPTQRNRSCWILLLLARNILVCFPFSFVPWRRETEARSGNICDGFGSFPFHFFVESHIKEWISRTERVRGVRISSKSRATVGSSASQSSVIRRQDGCESIRSLWRYAANKHAKVSHQNASFNWNSTSIVLSSSLSMDFDPSANTLLSTRQEKYLWIYAPASYWHRINNVSLVYYPWSREQADLPHESFKDNNNAILPTITSFEATLFFRTIYPKWNSVNSPPALLLLPPQRPMPLLPPPLVPHTRPCFLRPLSTQRPMLASIDTWTTTPTTTFLRTLPPLSDEDSTPRRTSTSDSVQWSKDMNPEVYSANRSGLPSHFAVQIAIRG